MKSLTKKERVTLAALKHAWRLLLLGDFSLAMRVLEMAIARLENTPPSSIALPLPRRRVVQKKRAQNPKRRKPS